MLKATFGAVKSTSSRITKRHAFVPSVISNVRQFGTSRTALSTDADRVLPGMLDSGFQDFPYFTVGPVFLLLSFASGKEAAGAIKSPIFDHRTIGRSESV